MRLLKFGLLAIVGMFTMSACCDRIKNDRLTKERVICMVDSVVMERLVFTPVVSVVKEDTAEQRMRMKGLVNITDIEPSIGVHLVYATPYNFMGRVLYKGIDKAFMLPETADRLKEAQRRLKMIRPDLNLIVYDAARPLSVQQEMWETVKATPNKIYVSNPANGGGLHNYGAAVDVSLMDVTGRALEMGSNYDFFGDEARVDKEDEMLRQERITHRELNNRRLLRKVMIEAGFIALPAEWWHFNLMSRQQALETLQVIE